MLQIWDSLEPNNVPFSSLKSTDDDDSDGDDDGDDNDDDDGRDGDDDDVSVALSVKSCPSPLVDPISHFVVTVAD